MRRGRQGLRLGSGPLGVRVASSPCTSNPQTHFLGCTLIPASACAARTPPAPPGCLACGRGRLEGVTAISLKAREGPVTAKSIVCCENDGGSTSQWQGQASPGQQTDTRSGHEASHVMQGTLPQRDRHGAGPQEECGTLGMDRAPGARGRGWPQCVRGPGLVLRVAGGQAGCPLTQDAGTPAA